MNQFVEWLNEFGNKTNNPKIWEIKGKRKEWVFKVERDPIHNETEWGWKVENQLFTWDKWAFDYMKKLIQEKETGIRIINHAKQNVPNICGVNGAACRHPKKCNTMLCSDCPIAEEFFAKRDGVILQYIDEKDDDNV